MIRWLRPHVRRALLLPALAAAIVLPATLAFADPPATSLDCTITVTSDVIPGVTTTPQDVIVFTYGLAGTADCSGTLQGETVTGPGNFGFTLRATESCLTLENGNGTFAMTAPTANGTRATGGTFQVSDPDATFTGGLSGHLIGASFVIGDCFTTPLTRVTTVLAVHVS
jgi:hypothetical protein